MGATNSKPMTTQDGANLIRAARVSTRSTIELVELGIKCDELFIEKFRDYPWRNTLDINMVAILAAFFSYFLDKDETKIYAKRVLNFRVSIDHAKKTLFQLLIDGNGKAIESKFKNNQHFNELLNEVWENKNDPRRAKFWTKVKGISFCMVTKKRAQQIADAIEKLDNAVDIPSELGSESMPELESESEPELGSESMPELESESEPEPQPEEETEKKIAQENNEFLDVLELCGKSKKTDTNDFDSSTEGLKRIPRPQDRAIRVLLSSRPDSGSPFLQSPKEDRFLQYYLTSYQLKYGKKHQDMSIFCPPLMATPENLEVGSEFEIDKYLYGDFAHNIQIENLGVIFEIMISPSDYILPNPHGAEKIIPPHTKFKVVEIAPKEYSNFCKPEIKTKKTTIKLKIIAQKYPVMPKEEELTEMVENAYETSRKAQLDIWGQLMHNRNISVCFSEDQAQGKQNVVMVELWAPQLQYIDLIAQVQRQQMNEEDVDYLDIYTYYGYSPSGHSEKEKNTIHAIFDKIAPLKRPLVVFRSMDDDEMAAICTSYKTEEIFSNFEEYAKDNNDFLSVSVDPYIAMSYYQQEEDRPKSRSKGNGLLKLTIPAGKKALAAEPTAYSRTGNNEFILRREGLKIKVDKITEKDGFSFIEATVV